MKTIFKISLMIAAFCLTGNIQAQQVSFGQIQNSISRGQDGINVFDVKKDSVKFAGLSVELGGAFAMQFQALNSYNDQTNLAAPYTNYRLNNLGNNFNLPNANMTIGAQLFDGVRVNMDLYLSARHHNETWVKGGYLQIDKLDFIKKDFLAGFMKYATFKIGQMENNYGDAHFRRTDNGNAIRNPFIGENIMDSFTTDMGAEVYYNRSGLVSMLGITNSKLNQSVAEIIPATTTVAAPDQNTVISPAILAKLGYDKQIDKDLRVRITGSYYHVANSSSNMYGSDRAGSRFYGVMSHSAYGTVPATAVANNFDPTANKDTGRFSPGFANWATSFMINPFVKYKGLEFFGTYELAKGGDSKGVDTARKFSQVAGDVLYRFGNNENLFVGAKYNVATGKLKNSDADNVTINRLETGLGWFMTKNILAKLDYISQNYKGFSQYTGTTPNDLYGGKFNGLMFEAVIAF